MLTKFESLYVTGSNRIIEVTIACFKSGGSDVKVSSTLLGCPIGSYENDSGFHPSCKPPEILLDPVIFQHLPYPSPSQRAPPKKEDYGPTVESGSLWIVGGCVKQGIRVEMDQFIIGIAITRARIGRSNIRTIHCCSILASLHSLTMFKIKNERRTEGDRLKQEH